MLDPRSSARLVALTPFQQVSAQLKEALRENVALKAQIAVLTAAGAKVQKPRAAKASKIDYPAAFEEVWAIYPTERQGTKKTAYKAWAARINAGVEPAEIMLGLQRYLAHGAATGKGTQYLYLAATFFGPDEHFTTKWPMHAAPARGGKFDPVAHVNQGAMPPAGEWFDGIIDITPR